MKYILGDEGLFGSFSLAVNIPMMLALLILPLVIQKLSGMYKINIWGYLLAAAGRLGVMAAAYMGSVPGMLVFTAMAAVGISPLQGNINAMVAACAENITLTTGCRLDGTVYSFASCGVKVGGALGTALYGWLLAMTGYVENAAVQAPETVSMLQFLYLWLPVILCILMAVLLVFLRVEQENKKLLGAKRNEGI